MNQNINLIACIQGTCIKSVSPSIKFSVLVTSSLDKPNRNTKSSVKDNEKDCNHE